MRTPACAIVAISLLVSAPVAHADDASYLAALNAAGVPMIHGDQGAIAGGNTICDQLRSTGAVSVSFGLMSAWRGQIIDAAQRELCPDTLH